MNIKDNIISAIDQAIEAQSNKIGAKKASSFALQSLRKQIAAQFARDILLMLKLYVLSVDPSTLGSSDQALAEKLCDAFSNEKEVNKKLNAVITGLIKQESYSPLALLVLSMLKNEWVIQDPKKLGLGYQAILTLFRLFGPMNTLSSSIGRLNLSNTFIENHDAALTVIEAWRCINVAMAQAVTNAYQLNRPLVEGSDSAEQFGKLTVTISEGRACADELRLAENKPLLEAAKAILKMPCYKLFGGVDGVGVLDAEGQLFAGLADIKQACLGKKNKISPYLDGAGGTVADTLALSQYNLSDIIQTFNNHQKHSKWRGADNMPEIKEITSDEAVQLSGQTVVSYSERVSHEEDDNFAEMTEMQAHKKQIEETIVPVMKSALHMRFSQIEQFKGIMSEWGTASLKRKGSAKKLRTPRQNYATVATEVDGIEVVNLETAQQVFKLVSEKGPWRIKKHSKHAQRAQLQTCINKLGGESDFTKALSLEMLEAFEKGYPNLPASALQKVVNAHNNNTDVAQVILECQSQLASQGDAEASEGSKVQDVFETPVSGARLVRSSDNRSEPPLECDSVEISRNPSGADVVSPSAAFGRILDDVVEVQRAKEKSNAIQRSIGWFCFGAFLGVLPAAKITVGASLSFPVASVVAFAVMVGTGLAVLMLRYLVHKLCSNCCSNAAGADGRSVGTQPAKLSELKRNSRVPVKPGSASAYNASHQPQNAETAGNHNAKFG